MNIVHALGWYFPEHAAGTEVYVQALGDRLHTAGHEVRIVVPEPGATQPREYEHEGLRVFRYPTPAHPTRRDVQPEARVDGSEHLHRWLKLQKPDLFHVHTLTTGLGATELGVARRLGAATVLTQHLPSLGYLCTRGTMMHFGRKQCDGLVSVRKCAPCALHARGVPRPFAGVAAAALTQLGPLRRAFRGRLHAALALRTHIESNIAAQRQLYELVDRWVLLNQFALDTLLANGAPPELLVLNRLGVSHVGLEAARPAAGPSSEITVGYLGRLDPLKGVRDMIHAISQVPTRMNMRFEFRGLAPASPEGHRLQQDLLDLSRRDPRVCLEPPVPARDVPSVLGRYDVLCVPSKWFENGPTVMYEAHAAGTPVVGARVGAMPEVIRDGINGALFHPGDHDALARILRGIGDNPDVLRTWSASLPAPRSMDTIAAEYADLYEQLLRERDARGSSRP